MEDAQEARSKRIEQQFKNLVECGVSQHEALFMLDVITLTNATLVEEFAKNCLVKAQNDGVPALVDFIEIWAKSLVNESNAIKDMIVERNGLPN